MKCLVLFSVIFDQFLFSIIFFFMVSLNVNKSKESLINWFDNLFYYFIVCVFTQTTAV